MTLVKKVICHKKEGKFKPLCIISGTATDGVLTYLAERFQVEKETLEIFETPFIQSRRCAKSPCRLTTPNLVTKYCYLHQRGSEYRRV